MVAVSKPPQRTTKAVMDHLGDCMRALRQPALFTSVPLGVKLLFPHRKLPRFFSFGIMFHSCLNWGYEPVKPIDGGL